MEQKRAKTTVFLDADDTILHSSETVISILNRRYGFDKSVTDLKDWSYRSIAPLAGQKEILDIYDSDEFWKNVKFNTEFFRMFLKERDNFNWAIATKGRSRNLELKELFIKEHLGIGGLNISFFGLLLDEETGYSKASVDMQGGIQIDDRTDSLLGTNAACRILIKNHREFYWNRTPTNEDNFYCANNWNEISTIINFLGTNPEFLHREYD